MRTHRFMSRAADSSSTHRRSALRLGILAAVCLALSGPAATSTASVTIRQLTTQAYPQYPSISRDGTTIAFVSASDLTGENPNHYQLAFTMRTDASGITQFPAIQPTAGCGGSPPPPQVVGAPSLSATGAVIVYTLFTGSTCGCGSFYGVAIPNSTRTDVSFPFGGITINRSVNDDGSRILYSKDSYASCSFGTELWLGDPTGLLYSHRISSNYLYYAKLSADGSHLVASNQNNNTFQLYDIAQGTGPILTGSTPDLSANGRRVLFTSTTDHVPGQNPYGVSQLFLYDDDTQSYRQYTFGTVGIYTALITADGTRGVFVFDNDIYVIDLSTGMFQEAIPFPYGYGPSNMSMTADGLHIVFLSPADLTGENPAHANEMFIADLGTSPPIPGDTDRDGIADDDDNCINVSNANQRDIDDDGIGDVCDLETCADNLDNDSDSLIDGADPDCPGLTISKFSWPPKGVPPGKIATVKGSGLGTSPGSVRIGNVLGSVTSWEDSKVKFVVPDVAPGVYTVRLESNSAISAQGSMFVTSTTPLKKKDAQAATASVLGGGAWWDGLYSKVKTASKFVPVVQLYEVINDLPSEVSSGLKLLFSAADIANFGATVSELKDTETAIANAGKKYLTQIKDAPPGCGTVGNPCLDQLIATLPDECYVSVETFRAMPAEWQFKCLNKSEAFRVSAVWNVTRKELIEAGIPVATIGSLGF